uniref:Uncharacterized protein n=1 Tax=Arundo donax TaxID=35708 RepID=A0A0A9AC66_ARUDO
MHPIMMFFCHDGNICKYLMDSKTPYICN